MIALRRLGKRIAAQRGAILAIDYGYAETQAGETLQLQSGGALTLGGASTSGLDASLTAQGASFWLCGVDDYMVGKTDLRAALPTLFHFATCSGLTR